MTVVTLIAKPTGIHPAGKKLLVVLVTAPDGVAIVAVLAFKAKTSPPVPAVIFSITTPAASVVSASFLISRGMANAASA